MSAPRYFIELFSVLCWGDWSLWYPYLLCYQVETPGYQLLTKMNLWM